MAKNGSMFFSNEELKDLRNCVLSEIQSNGRNYNYSGLNKLCIILYKLNTMIEPEEKRNGTDR